jgi:hypothetical protein
MHYTHSKYFAEAPTTELFMEDVINRETCRRHGTDIGQACWSWHDSSGFLLGAVCNNRAKRAGFNHEISDKALHLTRFRK